MWSFRVILTWGQLSRKKYIKLFILAPINGEIDNLTANKNKKKQKQNKTHTHKKKKKMMQLYV